MFVVWVDDIESDGYNLVLLLYFTYILYHELTKVLGEEENTFLYQHRGREKICTRDKRHENIGLGCIFFNL